jgi:hypothetical protein
MHRLRLFAYFKQRLLSFTVYYLPSQHQTRTSCTFYNT